MIDIRAILDELGVDFKSDGKNVGAADINIDCPFCGWEKHMGINVNNGYIWCWVCEFQDIKGHPSLLKALYLTTEIPWAELKGIMEEHGWSWDGYKEEPLSDGLSKNAWLPKECCDFTENTKQRDNALHYLQNRGFGVDEIEKYGLKYTVGGAYHKRIIIPIYFEGKIVAFTGRDYSGKQNRYKNAPLFMCSRRVKDSLYNYDNCVDEFGHSYLLEGPTDVWRMKEGMSVFRSALSSKQRVLIMRLNLNSLTIIFDPNATTRAYDAAASLSPFIPLIKVVRLTGKNDVSSMTKSEVLFMEKNAPIYRG